MAEPAVAALWAQVSFLTRHVQNLVRADALRRELAIAEGRLNALRHRVRVLERDRDAARAEVETLRLGRDELEKMRAATVAELEATRRLLGRITPDPRETGLLEERRELLARGVVPFDVSPCGVAGHRGVCRCDLGSSIPRGVVLEWAARLDAEIVMWSPALRAIVEEMARRGRQ